KKHEISLDGEWLLTTSTQNADSRPLTDAAWKGCKVPGQWLQQGFDISGNQKVFMARDFTVPKAGRGYRIVLRFEPIHAGVHYILNGKALGLSENLFTPVEWDVTDAISFDQANRIGLEMNADTYSEKLSYASGYAFHNLGGIDRSVRLFTLPSTHISAL